ncbi:MAG: DUF4340 domain-containing protein [Verrucomicrobiales bacterium]|nr:DUF4340 domain-containing protein [Verrucomicrobiales bacterium]
MGTKTLIRLLVALVVIGVIAAILHFLGSGGAVSEVSSSTDKPKIFMDFPINDVSKVVIRKKEGSVTLAKGETSWEVSEREGYPATTDPVIQLLRKVWDLKIVQPITIGRSQYGRLGLVAPEETAEGEESATIVLFQDKEGKDLASLWLGKVYQRSEGRPDPFGGGMATTDAGRYVKKGDSNSVYLVGDTFADVKIEAAEWIDKGFFKVEKIKSLELVTNEKANDWKLERKSETDPFVLVGATPNEKLDQNKLSSMQSAFSNAQMEDVYTGAEAKEQKTDVSLFKVVTFDGFRYEIAVGAKTDLNEMPLSLKVSADLVEKRTAGEEESAEEKTKLDEAFNASLSTLRKKLEQEKTLEGHVFKVRSYIVDSITKKRSELMEDKPEAAASEEVAPGVTLPGMAPSSLPPGFPKVTPPGFPKISSPTAPKAAPEAAPKTVPTIPEGTPKASPDGAAKTVPPVAPKVVTPGAAASASPKADAPAASAPKPVAPDAPAPKTTVPAETPKAAAPNAPVATPKPVAPAAQQ